MSASPIETPIVADPVPEPPSRWQRVQRWWARAAAYRLVVPALLLLVAFGLYLPRLAEPDKYLFDEILFAYTAGEYAEGNPDSYRWDHPCSVTKNSERCAQLFPEAQQGTRIGKYQWAHPPLGKLFMSGTILLFGNDPFGWRIAATFAGAVGIVVAYGLGRLVTGRQAVGALVAGLLLADTMYFTYSRMGLVDIFLTVLTMATMLAFGWYLTRPFERSRIPLLVTGLLMGMAIATKWSAAYGGFFIGLVVIWRFARAWRASRAGDATPALRRAVRDHVLLGPLALVGFPVAIYLGAYLPFFLSGNNGWDDFVDLQRAILRLQTTLDDDPRTASPWWTWPFDWRSVWFGTRSLADGRVAKTYALGNPFIYWAMLPAVGWTLVRWWREGRTLAFTVLAVGFFGQWLPWMLVDRSMYLYHFLPAVPFGALAIAASLVHLVERWGDWRRVMAIQYGVVVVLAFAFFYPIASYYPISERAMGLRMWLASWV